RMIVRGVMREWKPEQAAVTLSLEGLLLEEGTSEREERFIDQIASDHDVESEILNDETHVAVRAAMAALPTPQRRLIERRFFEDVPLATIARELGLSRPGAYVRQRIALNKLR